MDEMIDENEIGIPERSIRQSYFMNGGTVSVIHLIKLINTANTVISQNEGATFHLQFIRLRVTQDSSRQTHAGRTLSLRGIMQYEWLTVVYTPRGETVEIYFRSWDLATPGSPISNTLISPRIFMPSGVVLVTPPIGYEGNGSQVEYRRAQTVIVLVASNHHPTNT